MVAQYPYKSEYMINSLLYMLESLFIGLLLFLFLGSIIFSICLIFVNFKHIDEPFRFFGSRTKELEDNDLEYYINTPIDYNRLLKNEKSLTPRQQYLLGQCKDFPFEAPYDFAYGYTLTVWKAQGSEWDKVLGFEEAHPRDKEEHRKYLYTLITRAKKRLVMVIK